MAQAKRDDNRVPSLLGVSNADGLTPLPVYVDSATNRLLVSSTGGGGGAGTEYTEGDTDTTITGQAILWEDASDTLAAVSATKPLPVTVVSGSASATEYVEDAAAPANPQGGIVQLRRKDTLSATEVSADGDVITANATAKGELYVKHTDSIPVTDNGGSLTVDGTVGVSGTVTVDSELTTADVDTGAGTDTRAVVGLIYGASGGGTLVSTTNPLPVGDNGGSLTVDGTVAATQSGTWNVGTVTTVTAVSDAQVQGKAAHDAAVSGNPVLQAGYASAAAPADVSADGDAVRAWRLRNGAAATVITAAGALIGGDAANGLDVDVTRVSGSVAVTNADLTTLAGTVRAEDAASGDGHTGIPALAVRKGTPANTSGTDGDYETLQVSAGRLWASATIDAALPAGTNAIGKLAANSGVDIGDVDVTSVVPGTTATSLGKAEDAAHSSGDTGVMALGVRNDAGTAFAADGDYVPLSVDASGAVRVTGGGGGTQYTEDAAAPADPVGNAMIMVRKDTLAGLTSADGDNVAARGTDKGELYVKHSDAIPVTDNGGNISIDDGGNSITVDGTVAVTNSDLTTLAGAVRAEDVASADAHTGIPAMAVRKATPANTSGTDGDYEMLQMSAGRLWVDPSGVTLTVASHAVTNAGSFAVQAAGDVAHDAADSGSPVKVGGQARTTNPTAVADADRSNFITDKLGKQVVVGSIRDLKAQQQTTITSSTSETTVLSAVASTFLDVYGVIVANTSATACDVTFKDATAGTTRFNIYVPAGETRGFMLNESAAHNQATVNNNWTATCGTSVSAIKITMLAVKNT